MKQRLRCDRSRVQQKRPAAPSVGRAGRGLPWRPCHRPHGRALLGSWPRSQRGGGSVSAPGVFRDTSPGASCGGCERGPTNRPGSVFGNDITPGRAVRQQRESRCRVSKAPAVRVGGKVRGRSERATRVTEVRDWWSVAGVDTSKGAASVRAFPIPHGVERQRLGQWGERYLLFRSCQRRRRWQRGVTRPAPQPASFQAFGASVAKSACDVKSRTGLYRSENAPRGARA